MAQLRGSTGTGARQPATPNVGNPPGPERKSSEATFDIDPRVVYQLGEELVTNELQALLELVKNAYDADARSVRISIDTRVGPGDESSFPEAQGLIVVEDNGEGMDAEAIESGWLLVSSSLKRAMKLAGKVTQKHKRTPLGDKGLGRLSAQRLGDNLEIYTRRIAEPIERYVGVHWPDFLTAERLRDVPVLTRQILPPQREQGTRLVVSNLRNLSMWEADDAPTQLATQLSRFISPYRGIRDFGLGVSINDKPVDLAKIDEAIRRSARVQFAFIFDGQTLRIDGKCRLNMFQPSYRARPEDRLFFRQYVRADNGRQLRDFLAERLAHGAAADLAFHPSKEPGWYLEFGQSIDIGPISDIVRLNDGSFANPGPFYGEVEGYQLDPDENLAAERTNVDYVKSLAGIRVFRDGFGIQLSHDWLNLARSWTSAPSWYSLRPDNTLGFVEISAAENANLQETSDREGFKESPYTKNFQTILQRFVKHANVAQTQLRRGLLAFRTHVQASEVGLEAETPEEAIEELARDAKKASALRSKLVTVTAAVGANTTETAELQERLKSELSPAGLRSARGQLKELADSLKEAHAVLVKVQEDLASLEKLAPALTVVRTQVDTLRNELNDTYELMSLGLTSEAMSHEIAHVMDNLAIRTKQVKDYITAHDKGELITTYVDDVRSAIGALRRQLAHMAPSLRYARDTKERLDLNGFLVRQAKYHNERMFGRGIRVKIEPAPNEFWVNVNPGKLTQVVDNLVINAQYWIQQAIDAHQIDEGVMTITVEPPLVAVEDSGPGIDRSVENSLFEPFVTTKTTGRGLGLYVVRQLLATDGAGVRLAPDRNAAGRKYKFILDLSPLTAEKQN
jgi:signal transduction histidine kinase